MIGFYFILPVCAKNSCEESVSAASISNQSGYSADDFIFSPHWSQGTREQHHHYARWAAEQANWVARVFGQVDVQEIFAQVAAQRFLLAQRMRHGDAQRDFGALREVGASTGVSPFGYHFRDIRRPIPQAILRNLQEKKRISLSAKYLWYVPKVPGIQKAWHFYINSYRTLGGTLFPGVSFLAFHLRWQGSLSLHHPCVEFAQTIFDDVMARLENLGLNESLTDTEIKHEFFYALFGFFNAMPYARGSSSIGRVIFAGIYLSLFHEKLNLSPDADYLAMLSEFEVFMESLEHRVDR